MSVKEKNNKRLLAYNTWKEKYNAEKNYTAFVERNSFFIKFHKLCCVIGNIISFAVSCPLTDIFS